jgi:nitrous oxidase accessory protein NosD
MRFNIIIAVLLLAGSSQASTLHVCSGGCNYSSIQDAIDAASLGDSIEVQSGYYNEQIVINKDVTLKGIDTGEGLPRIYVIYLCNHPNSVVSDIGSDIRLGDCPRKDISIYNNTMGIGTVVAHNTKVIKPILDFKGDPSYTIELQANKSAVNAGDDFGLRS